MIANTRKFDDYDAFKKHMEGEGGGGFADLYWCGIPPANADTRREQGYLPRDPARTGYSGRASA